MVTGNTWRTLLRNWCLCLLCWAGVTAALSLQLARMTSMGWPDALRVTGGAWLGWAIAAPLLYLLTSRLPLAKKTWRVSVPAHLAAGVAALALVNLTQSLAGPQSPMILKMPPDMQPPGADAAPGPIPPKGMFVLQGFAPAGGRPPFGPQRGDWIFRFGLPMHLPALLVIMAAAHALHFSHRAQERERQALELSAGLARARFDALKMQIQPHFLFNALNSIAALVHKDAEAADQMIGALSEFLRFTLASSERREVTLIEELEFVRRYVAIEQVRFDDRLQFETEAAPDILNALVPMLILQPLVENAVRHALARVPGVRITVRAHRGGGLLHIAVHDDGPGTPGAQPSEGIGLANTRARLRELHGDRASVEIRADDGFTVALTMPFQTS